MANGNCMCASQKTSFGECSRADGKPSTWEKTEAFPRKPSFLISAFPGHKFWQISEASMNLRKIFQADSVILPSKWRLPKDESASWTCKSQRRFESRCNWHQKFKAFYFAHQFLDAHQIAHSIFVSLNFLDSFPHLFNLLDLFNTFTASTGCSASMLPSHGSRQTVLLHSQYPGPVRMYSPSVRVPQVPSNHIGITLKQNQQLLRPR